MEKCGRQKVLTKFFLCSETQIDRKLWSPIFLWRIRTKGTRLGSQWIFPQTNKINYKHADYLYIYHWKNASNESNAGHIRSFCDCQMFQVNFVPSLVADRKTPFGSLFKTIFSFAYCQDDLRVAMLLAPGHNFAAPEPSTEEIWRQSLALMVAVKRCGRL